MTEVERWGVLELQVDGPVSTVFRHESGESAYAESFQDGDRWLIRFMPGLEGDWACALAGTSHAFTCDPATTPGPVRRVGTTFRRADGTAYHPLTTTWFDHPTGDSADRWAAACRALAASPFNRVRLRAGNPQHLETQVRDLLAAGIDAEILLPSDEPAIRDLVNRLAAYRNVSWCLDASSDARHLAELIAECDSSNHLISIHTAPEAVDPGPPWFTHLSVPLENLRGVSALRRDYAKPVLVDACGSEGDGSTPDTSLRPEELLTRIWEGTVRGAHVTHGEWYVDSDGGPWSAGGTRPTGVVAQRLRLLREVLDELPDGVEPIDDYRDAPTLAVPGSYYLQYLGEHQFPKRTFTLPAGTYQVDVLDVWNHTVRSTRETVADTLTVRLPGTQYQAIQIRRAS
ncbi:hypothetical protein E0H75_38200 [Kribbella capetownensis]|uniref:DUF5605 domain-containing protein n=1 Tax=Kribbella capetownensis TaxID=1572659 RepID=A0A4R0JA92_9ACTN|nr:DUF5605 domain-containing protein [Kribbella capetownensis]TCC42847.1 hypothetical protein E0H75_38200 [Kribbella capetownensis]